MVETNQEEEEKQEEKEDDGVFLKSDVFMGLASPRPATPFAKNAPLPDWCQCKVTHLFPPTGLESTPQFEKLYPELPIHRHLPDPTQPSRTKTKILVSFPGGGWGLWSLDPSFWPVPAERAPPNLLLSPSIVSAPRSTGRPILPAGARETGWSNPLRRDPPKKQVQTLPRIAPAAIRPFSP